MSDCPRSGKLFGACKFSPRYDRSDTTPLQLEALMVQFTSDIEAVKATTYVRDVCERCGKTVERGVAP